MRRAPEPYVIAYVTLAEGPTMLTSLVECDFDALAIGQAVRQLRGEAHPAVQVRNCDLALAHGTGGSLATRHAGATLILERE